MKKVSKNKLKRSAVVIRIITLIILIVFIPSGCASKFGKKTVKTSFYSDCYEPIDKLRENTQKLGKNVLGGAVLGFLAGAAAGHKIGDGDSKTTVVSGVIGLIFGAGVSYLITKEVQEKEWEERYKIYSDNLDDDYKYLNTAVKVAREAAACYKQSYDQLKIDYQANRVTKADMLVKLEEIRAGTNDAKFILNAFNDAAAERIKTYDEIVKLEKARPSGKLPDKDVVSVQERAKNIENKRNEGEKVLEELNDYEVAVNNTIEIVRTAMSSPHVYSPVASFDKSSIGCQISSGMM